MWLISTVGTDFLFCLMSPVSVHLVQVEIGIPPVPLKANIQEKTVLDGIFSWPAGEETNETAMQEREQRGEEPSPQKGEYRHKWHHKP